MEKKQRIKVIIAVTLMIACIGIGFGLYESKTSSREDEPLGNEYLLNIDASEKGVEIGNMMYGLFFEDINFAADGGIYAELIKNRSFEFTKELATNGALPAAHQSIECSGRVHQWRISRRNFSNRR